MTDAWEADYLNRIQSGARGRANDLDDDDVEMPPPRSHAALDDILAEHFEEFRAPAPLPDETELEQLTRHWMNERHAPDILLAQDALLARLLDHIRRQSDTIQLLRGDPSTSEEEHIRIVLAQTEVERVKFIVRSYVRTRLFKIERYARYILANEHVQTLLTTAERDYASRHVHLADRHFHSTVLQSLPPDQAGLDDVPHFIMPSIITEPDNTRAVFALARRNVTCRTRENRTIDLPKGSLTLIAFATVADEIARGGIELV